MLRVLDGAGRVIDGLSEVTGRLAGWAFVFVGFIVTYEVFVRYVLISPTVWVDEFSRNIQVWASYLAVAYVLKNRQHIVIDVLLRDSNSWWRRSVDLFALAVIVLFAAVAVKYGWDIWLKSTLAGHRTDTYLAVPLFYIQASIWVGFGLLCLQALAEAVKVCRGDPVASSDGAGHH